MSPSRAPQRNLLAAAFLALALVVGLWLRLAPVMSADFPLNDGGMFLDMIQDLQRVHFSLPEVTSYNGLDIPYVYPPLGFYVGAGVATLTGGTGADILRFVPVTVNILAAVAFALLAREVLPSGVGASLATFVFVVLPGSFVWQIMGGGLTRAFGMLFALLALREAHRFYTRPSRLAWLLMVIFSSGTILSHLDWALFLAVSVFVVIVAFGRSREGVLASLFAAVSIAVVTSPWWATSLLRFGFAPFLAASQTGSWVSFLVGDADQAAKPVAALLVLALVAVFAALALFNDRRLLFIGWCLLIVIADVRAYAQLLTVPAALGLGYLAGGILAMPSRREGEPADTLNPEGRPPRRRPLATILALLLIAWNLYQNAGFVGDARRALAPLPASARDAMAWVSTETPVSSQFLVLTSAGWAVDRDSEWFPALARRRSLTTVQGTEWLTGEYWRYQELHALARECESRDSSCLDRWTATTGVPYSHVYLVRSGGNDCCQALRESLRSDTRYSLLYDGAGATVFARVGD